MNENNFKKTGTTAGLRLIPAAFMPFITIAAYIFWKSGKIDWSILTVIIPTGLLTCGIWHCAKARAAFRTHSDDTDKGCTRQSAMLYSCEMILPYIWTGVLSIMGLLPVHTVVIFLTISVALACASSMRKSVGQGTAMLLQDLDSRTARLQIMFTALLSASLIAARLL